MKPVNPDDLSNLFGLGAQLKSMTLDVTDKSVTEGVVKGMTGLLSQYSEIRLVLSDSPTDFSHEAQLDQGMLIKWH